MRKAYRNTTPRIRTNEEGKMTYWWTGEIGNLAREAKSTRSRYLRARRRDAAGSEDRWETYKNAKRRLRKEIGREKAQRWKSLLEDLEGDVFGGGYQIVRSQLSLANPKINLSTERKMEVFEELFIGGRGEEDLPPPLEQCGGVPEVTLEELQRATSKIKKGKAPGPDGIPPEAVKTMIEGYTEYFRHVFWDMLQEREFPNEWGTAKLVLIEKPGGRGYRPICLLNVAAKVYEQVINGRLQKAIEEKGDFHTNQFGFRKGRTTVQAIERVIASARSRGLSVHAAVIFVNVRNAFNVASWRLTIRELVRRGVSEYLASTVRSYFSGREVILEKGLKRSIGGGVPQGSVLGPTL